MAHMIAKKGLRDSAHNTMWRAAAPCAWNRRLRLSDAGDRTKRLWTRRTAGVRLQRVVALNISSGGRSGGSADARDATSSGGDNGGSVCSGQVLRVRLYVGLLPLQH